MPAVKIKLESPECMPYRQHKMDAGLDLRSNNNDFILLPGARAKIHTGVRIAIPPRHMGMVVPRSSLGINYSVALDNTVGIIDSEYRGEIIVSLVNRGSKELEIKKYDRFCQLIIIPVLIDILRVVDELDETRRGENGFGSTGKG